VSIKQSAAISTEKKPGKDCERTLLKKKERKKKDNSKERANNHLFENQTGCYE